MNITSVIIASLLAVSACNGEKKEVVGDNLTEENTTTETVDTISIDQDETGEGEVDEGLNSEEMEGIEKSNQENPAAGSTMMAGHYHMVVSFYSPGMGINREAHEKFKAFLGDNTDVLKYEATRWGREGEIDYCIMYEGDAAVHPAQMNRKIRESLKGFDRINFTENSPCVHKR